MVSDRIGPGSRIGPYDILLPLATSSMARVWLAVDRTGVVVVIKQVVNHTRDPELAKCLREEARIGALVRHPNTCRVIGMIDDDQVLALVMEYVEGIALRRLASLSLPPEVAIDWIAGAARALDYIHGLRDATGRAIGVVHRDVNPSNLLVGPEGQVVLLDFGIAWARDRGIRTRTGLVKGTRDYLAPEQIRGEPVDRRTDVYGLGVTIFELLTGVSPFRRGGELATLNAITDPERPDLARLRPGLPPAIAAAVERAIALAPADRFRTAGEMAAALTAASGGVDPARAAAATASLLRDRLAAELDERRARIRRALEGLTPRDVDSRTEPLGRSPAPVARPPAPPAPDPAADPPPGSHRFALVAGALGAVALAAAGFLAWTSREREPRDRAAPSGQALPVQDASTAREPDAGATREPAIDATPPAPKAAGPRPRVNRPAATGYLSIDSYPYATIFVDGKRLGVTPLFRKRVPAGRRAVRAICSCGPEQSFEVVVPAGRPAPTRRLTWP